LGLEVVGVEVVGGAVIVVTEDDEGCVLAADVDVVGSVVRDDPEHALRSIAAAARTAVAADLRWSMSVLPPARGSAALARIVHVVTICRLTSLL
jgi:hypothetical protein